MCELFGVSAPQKIRLNSLLHTFFSHADRHPHGWGMALFHKNVVCVEKQAVTANKSARLQSYLEKPVIADTMIAHIRLATKGNMEYDNCHPFVRQDNSGRSWTLAHNGTIFEAAVLNPFFYVQEGQTDSERILYYIIEQVNHKQDELGRSLSGSERFQVVDEIICEIAEENKLNLLIYDGEYYYVHSNLQDSLYLSERDGGVVFSTVPLDDGRWKALPLNTLLAYQQGSLVYQGTDHGCEYVEDPEKMRLLFLDFSAL
ncbi:MAG: class II glutamine amidotransferase [Lachnospiraceae bacterium]|nr:class II glutamine amidotransferase [Lachnospiraceae bacterium]